MPTLPRAISQQTLSNRSPSLKVDSSSYRATGQGISQIGEALSVVGQKFKDLQNLQEYTAASTRMKQRLGELRQTANQDEDIYTMEERYKQEIQKIRNDTIKKVSDRENQIRFAQDFDNFAMSTDFEIRSISRQKQIDRAKATFSIDLEQSKKDYYGASSPLARKQLMDQINFRIDEHARLGVMKEEEAVKLKKAYEDEVRTGQVLYDMEINPEMARENIQDGLYGLTPEEESEALGMVQQLRDRREKENKIAGELAMQEDELELNRKVDEGTATIIEINEAEKNGRLGLPGGIRPEVAEDFRKQILGATKPTDEQKANAFIDLQDRFVQIYDPKKKKSTADIKTLATFRSDVLRAMSSGKVDLEDGEIWIKNTATSFDKALNKEVEKNNPRAGWKALAFWIDGLDVEEKAQLKAKLGKELMGRVEQGQNEDEAVQQIIENQQKEMNPNRAAYKIGDIIPTPHGAAKVIGFFPDGEPEVEITK